MDAERFEYVEKSEQTECDGKNPRMGDYGFCRNEGECHENSADFVDDNPAGVFGAGVFHRFFHERDGCEKDDEGGCNKKCKGSATVEFWMPHGPFDSFVVDPVIFTPNSHGVGDNRCGKASHGAGGFGRHA